MKLCVIPARGGSKRIPRKNIKPFAGKPVIAYSIEAAKRTELFDRIIVSTDDADIAHVATQFGAEAPFLRPSDLSDDHTGTNAVVKHALEWHADQGQRYDIACCIYATAPFVQPRYLKQGLDRLLQDKAAFAFSVTSFPFPIQRALRLRDGHTVEAMQPEHISTRSQDLEEAYHDAGQFYWGRADAFLTGQVLFSSISRAVVLPRHLVQDIDTKEDWERAEYMYRALQLGGALTE